MFKITDEINGEKKPKTFHVTRGDYGIIEISAKNDDKTDYEFQINDVIRFGIFEKNDMNKIIMQKDLTVTEISTKVDFEFNKEDTTIGGIISKPVDYWYEIQLNPNSNPQTIVGYDEDGAKIFRIYPEGAEEE